MVDRATLTAWLRPIEGSRLGPHSASEPSPSNQNDAPRPIGCDNCRYLDECPEEHRQEVAGWCENWETDAT